MEEKIIGVIILGYSAIIFLSVFSGSGQHLMADLGWILWAIFCSLAGLITIFKGKRICEWYLHNEKIERFFNESPAKQESEEKVEKERKEERVAEMVKEEEKREKIEKFQTKRIGDWSRLAILLLPLLPFIALPFLLILAFLDKDLMKSLINDLHWYHYAIFMGYILFLIWAAQPENSWDERLEAKRRLYEKNRGFEFYPERYSHDFIYADSELELFSYRTLKILGYVICAITIVVVGIVLWLLFLELAISPTTIIIILLLIIIFKLKG